MHVNGNGGRAARSGELVASFSRYEEAQRAMDYLAARGLTPAQIAMMASDVRAFEESTGAPRRYGDAAVDGAAAGAVTGALLSFALGLLALIVPLASGLTLPPWGLVAGAAIGALTGMTIHAVTGRDRADAGVPRTHAGRYDLIAAPGAAENAREALRSFTLQSAA